MTPDNDEGVIEDRPDERRYELRLGDETATITYRLAPGRITFIHTHVAEALSGRGIASRMARFVLDDARNRGLEVVPICPYVGAFIRRHPEYLDLVPEWAHERYLEQRT
jgi:predicted GNAT family acetyltransferase